MSNQIIKKSQTNIQKALTENIWNEFSLDLRKFVKSKLKDSYIAEDILQDIFYKIHNNINQLKDNSKLGSWVYQIAKNSITDFFRQEQKAQEVLMELKKEKDFSLDNASNEILSYCMEFFVSQLPEIYKNAIQLTEYNNVSQVELAKKENISISAAKSRVQRARAKLKKIIKEYSHYESIKQGIDIQSLTENCPISKK